MTKPSKPPLPDYAQAIRHKEQVENSRGGKQARKEWWKFYRELYSTPLVRHAMKMGAIPIDAQMEFKEMAETPAKTDAIQIVNPYTGEVEDYSTAAIPNLDETAYWKREKSLWPDLPQVDFPELLGKNILLLESRWMTPTEYGPYFALRIYVDGIGQCSTLSRGEVFNQDIAHLSGVLLADGEKDPERGNSIGSGIWFALAQMPNKNNPNNPYWNMVPAFEPENSKS